MKTILLSLVWGAALSAGSLVGPNYACPGTPLSVPFEVLVKADPLHNFCGGDGQVIRPVDPLNMNHQWFTVPAQPWLYTPEPLIAPPIVVPPVRPHDPPCIGNCGHPDPPPCAHGECGHPDPPTCAHGECGHHEPPPVAKTPEPQTLSLVLGAFMVLLGFKARHAR